MKLLIIAPFCCLLLACGGTYTFVKTTGHTAEARKGGCAFDVLTTRPNKAYDELGVFEPYGAVNDATAFRKAVADELCRQGGDAVIAEINGHGQYVRGTAIRYTNVLPSP